MFAFALTAEEYSLEIEDQDYIKYLFSKSFGKDFKTQLEHVNYVNDLIKFGHKNEPFTLGINTNFMEALLRDFTRKEKKIPYFLMMKHHLDTCIEKKKTRMFIRYDQCASGLAFTGTLTNSPDYLLYSNVTSRNKNFDTYVELGSKMNNYIKDILIPNFIASKKDNEGMKLTFSFFLEHISPLLTTKSFIKYVLMPFGYGLGEEGIRQKILEHLSVDLFPNVDVNTQKLITRIQNSKTP